MTEEEKKPEESKAEPAKGAEKPAAEAKPAETKPAAEAKPAAAAAKPAAPAAAAAHGAAKAEPAAPPAVGPAGQFLKEHGISTTPLPDSCGCETAEIDGANLAAALRLLRSSSEIALDFLVTVSGVDNVDTFDSVYHLQSFSNKNELVLKVRIKKSDVPEGKLPNVPSIANLWQTANWHERETYDLVGIRYNGHPYPRRILNTWDWDGYPLRRDYKQPIDALNDKNPNSMR
ncbi:MAG: NADH-quinone oxidoreductase subunit C [Cyanobacteria bacterium SZAS LIN-5]|nr:NADH-quinone oxidoreductase subunit C [Cyanobacteria bacterium SZAS LIN-5]